MSMAPRADTINPTGCIVRTPKAKYDNADIIVFGVDPGPITGIVGLRFRANHELAADPVAIECTPNAVMPVLLALVPEHAARVFVGYEPFVVSRRAARSGHAAAGRVTRDLCGRLEALTEHGKRWRVHSHAAGQISEWASTQRLQAAGLWTATTRMDHARSGACQAVYTATWHAKIPDPLSKHSKATTAVPEFSEG